MTNPVCRRACRLNADADDGFVIEDGCPIHDRVGYTPFKVFWFRGKPWLIGSLALDTQDDSRRVVAAFCMGLS